MVRTCLGCERSITAVYDARDPMLQPVLGVSPGLGGVMRQLPCGIGVSRVLGGLAPDSQPLMAEQGPRYLRAQPTG